MHSLIALVIPVVIIVSISLFVTLLSILVVNRVRSGPGTSTRAATRDGVLFVVCGRRWQRVVLRSVGIAMIVIGCFPLLVAASDSGGEEELGAAITAAVLLIFGSWLVWQAHAMVRSRLEVTLDWIWVFRSVGAPKQVTLNDIAQLAPVTTNNYGGITIRSATKRLFSANKLMFGYRQLIDYLEARRPDLAIPAASQPL